MLLTCSHAPRSLLLLAVIGYLALAAAARCPAAAGRCGGDSPRLAPVAVAPESAPEGPRPHQSAKRKAGSPVLDPAWHGMAHGIRRHAPGSARRPCAQPYRSRRGPAKGLELKREARALRHAQHQYSMPMDHPQGPKSHPRGKSWGFRISSSEQHQWAPG
jgi:hypothetical protein